MTPFDLLIGYGAGLVTAFVLWRITLFVMQRKIAKLETELEVERDRTEWCLITVGDILNHLNLKERYSGELIRLLLLRGRPTPTSTRIIDNE
jgi:hypothetical protein